MYEPFKAPLIPKEKFFVRFFRHFAAAAGMVVFSLALGMEGYKHYESLPWRDAFLNSAMLLGGMGPVNAPRTDCGKIFAGLYALFAGLVFIVVASVLVAPIAHRLLHRFHVSND